MSRRVVLGLLTALAAVLVASGVAVAATRSPAGLGNLDLLCNHGHGLHLRATDGVTHALLSTETSRGVTVVGLDASSPSDPSRVLEPMTLVAVTSDCTLDRTFGNDGWLRPPLPRHESPEDVALLAPALHGRFFVLSTDRRSIWIGEFEPTGTLDRTFGHRGWEPLSQPGLDTSQSIPLVTAVVQEADGTILVGAGVTQPPDDAASSLIALHADGQRDRRFGRDGLVAYDPLEGGRGASLANVLVQPDGSIAAIGSFGFTNYQGDEQSAGGPGCSRPTIEWLNQRGDAEPTSEARFDAQRSLVTTTGFVGASFLDAAGGVGLLGEGDRCAHDVPQGHPYAVFEGLTPAGGADAHVGEQGTTFCSIPDETAGIGFAARTLPDGDVVLESESRGFEFQDFSAGGRALRRFARRGVLELPSPSTVGYAAPNVLVGPRGDFVVVLPTATGVTVEERLG
jgi:hypothetical protein